MVIYIPKNIDVYNTHLKNLTEAYSFRNVEIIVGYETFIYGSIIPDAIHFHMVEGLLHFMDYNEQLFFLRLNLFKSKGTKFIYTAHDILPHKKISVIDYTSFFSRFLSYVDLMVHHGQNSIEIHKMKFPCLIDKRHIVCHHGDYVNDMKEYQENKNSARKLLNLPANKKIILTFGQLQFKNVNFADEVFRLLVKNNKDSYFLMAGIYPVFRYNAMNLKFYKLNNNLINKFRFKKRIILDRVSNYKTYLIFKASDLVFLPHSSGLTTGIIPMAATLGIPFVYPDIGVFKEQADNCLSQIYERKNKYSACKAIEKILDTGVAVFDNSKWLENNNWRKHIDTILSNL